GFLQIEPYARALFQRYAELNRSTERDDVEKATEFRIRRQELLRDPRKSITVIQGEAALATWFPSRAVMVEQIRHISRLISEGHAEIRILPLDREIRLIPITCFEIFDDSWVESETATTALR